MKNYITLAFWNKTTDEEVTIQIDKSNITAFRLYNITNTLRLKRGEYIPSLVVNQYHIIAKTNDMTNEILQNYILDEISIYENDNLLERFSVKLDNPNKQYKYENSTLELLAISEAARVLHPWNTDGGESHTL